jgi:hypothetical protein
MLIVVFRSSVRPSSSRFVRVGSLGRRDNAGKPGRAHCFKQVLHNHQVNYRRFLFKWLAHRSSTSPSALWLLRLALPRLTWRYIFIIELLYWFKVWQFPKIFGVLVYKNNSVIAPPESFRFASITLCHQRFSIQSGIKCYRILQSNNSRTHGPSTTLVTTDAVLVGLKLRWASVSRKYVRPS